MLETSKQFRSRGDLILLIFSIELTLTTSASKMYNKRITH